MSSFALIPGAGGAAWYWHRVEPLLRQAGHEAIAIDLPGDDPAAGLPRYARLVLDAIEDREDVVLVAQSLGAFTAPLVAAATPVRAIVLVNAMIPSPGETPGAWWASTGSLQARESAARRHGYDKQFDLGVYFLHDVPPYVAATGAQHQRDRPMRYSPRPATSTPGRPSRSGSWPARMTASSPSSSSSDSPGNDSESMQTCSPAVI